MTDRYNTPVKGTLDWHVPLNENFEALENDVEVRDIEENLDKYVPDAGRKFYATDTGRKYIGDGSNWSDASLTVPTVSSDPSDPAMGQLWYNASADALRVNVSNGVKDIASGDGSDSTSGDSDNTSSGDGYYSGSVHRTSDYSSLQAAVDTAEPKDRVLVDTDHTVSSDVTLKSDILIRGDGGTIINGDGANANVLKPENVANVWIDGVEIDGNKQNNLGGRLIGGIDLGTIENLRITNCHIHDSANNGIELQEKSGGEYKDIYIANNRIEQNDYHGIVMGVKNSGASIHDVIVEKNTVVDSIKDQDIGIFGQTSACYNIAFLENDVSASSAIERGGTMMALEEKVNDSIMYGNTVSCHTATKAGMGATKDAENCIVANNYVENANRSLICAVFDFFDGRQDVCAYNLFTENHVDSGSMGFWYKNLDGAINVSGNRVTNTSPVISDGGGNTTDLGPYTFENNGSSISGGVPSSIGSSASWTDSNGNTLGSASWNRGSVDPSNPVSVSVQTSI